MPMDAVCLGAVTEELRRAALGARIDKIQQPTRDQIVLLLPRGMRLLLNAGGNQPRLQLTNLLRENPQQPPMFCMLLRKHLTGAKLVAVEQPEMERVVILTLEGRDEMGEVKVRKLVLEAVGRQANLILLDEDGRIMDCMRRVDLDLSEKRQLLPGLFYHLPPAQAEKCSPLSVTGEELPALLQKADGEMQLDRWLLNTFFGLSPLVCREIAYRTCGATDGHIFALDDAQRAALAREWDALTARIREGRFEPTMVVQGGKPLDFSYFPITQYGTAAENVRYHAFSELLDAFYETREKTERMRRMGHDLLQTATSARDRVRRKLAVQEKEYATTQNRDALRKAGDLITANLYRMEKGATVLRAEDYYEEGCPEIEIRLDPRLAPQQNAAKYYKNYNKAKTAEKMLSGQMEKGRAELDYLESILAELQQAELEQDLREIRAELKESGYIKQSAGEKKQMRSKALKPRLFRTSAGLFVSVGRNNRQNDQLTCKEAGPRDIWFHTQKIHGSHVILHTAGAEPDEQSMTEAAMLAAYYSQAREGQNVPVDYTPVRFVKKPAGAKPGMVIYTTYQTAYVTPDAARVKALAEK